ncbi:MAG TPA: HAD family phosphatase [Ignavibacteriaceae bacterium]|nr:HAD family phosphatase [Ignavibacteriaceae bacterium]
MIKAIFWDNDGILVNTEELYFKANREIFSSIGINLNKKQFVEFFLVRGKGAWHLAEKKGFTKDEIEILRQKRNALYTEMLVKENLLIDGVADVLMSLHGKYKMGLVTSSRRNHLEAIHQNTNLLRFLDFIITSDDCKTTKPDPAPYLMAVEASGFKKEECIVIEDSERGLLAANAAGLKCIVIPTELTKNGDFKKAFKVLKNIKEVLKIL